jgi:hypothetical protein
MGSYVSTVGIVYEKMKKTQRTHQSKCMVDMIANHVPRMSPIAIASIVGPPSSARNGRQDASGSPA